MLCANFFLAQNRPLNLVWWNAGLCYSANDWPDSAQRTSGLVPGAVNQNGFRYASKVKRHWCRGAMEVGCGVNVWDGDWMKTRTRNARMARNVTRAVVCSGSACSVYLKWVTLQQITYAYKAATREMTVALTFLNLRKGFGGFFPASITESSLWTRCYVTWMTLTSDVSPRSYY